jgi:predicted membrane protein
MENSSGGVCSAVGTIILLMVAFCYPFLLLGIGFVVVVITLVAQIFTKKESTKESESHHMIYRSGCDRYTTSSTSGTFKFDW